jgi:hypothetical protein
MGWIKFMKVLTGILLAIMLIGSVVCAVLVYDYTDSGIGAFCSFIGLAVLSFASVGFTMVFLNLAQDVRKTRIAVEASQQFPTGNQPRTYYQPPTQYQPPVQNQQPQQAQTNYYQPTETS